MSDYTNTFGGAAKDGANSTILGAQHDTQYDAIATMSATKANKIASATNENLISQDSNGDLVDSGVNKDDPEFDSLLLTEAADHTSTPAAGKGIVWVKNDAPTSLMYTDDAGTDFDITNLLSKISSVQFGYTMYGHVQSDGTVSADNGLFTASNGGTGIITITFDATQADTNYVVIVTPVEANARVVHITGKSTTGFTINTENQSGTDANSDVDVLCIRGDAWADA